MDPIQIILDNLLIFIIASLGVASVLVFHFAKQYQENKAREELETETMEDRISQSFISPVKTQGSPIKSWVKQRSLNNAPKTIGYARKGKKHNVLVVDRNNSFHETEGVTIQIISGSSKLPVYVKEFLYRLFSFDFLVEYHDVPIDKMKPSDNIIWYDPELHLIEKNGLKRHASPQSNARIWEQTMTQVHENYLETLQNIPEIYSQLNTRVAGQLKIDNNKSENIRKFEEMKERQEKDLD